MEIDIKTLESMKDYFLGVFPSGWIDIRQRNEGYYNLTLGIQEPKHHLHGIDEYDPAFHIILISVDDKGLITATHTGGADIQIYGENIKNSWSNIRGGSALLLKRFCDYADNIRVSYIANKCKMSDYQRAGVQ